MSAFTHSYGYTHTDGRSAVFIGADLLLVLLDVKEII